MNILFMNDTTGLGGGEIWASRMLGALQSRGHRCGIAAPVSARLHSTVRDPDMRFRYSRLDSLGFVPKLREFVEDESVDVILCTVLGSRLEAWALNELCLTSKRIPAIFLKLGLPPYPGSVAADYGYGLHPAFRKLLVVCKHNRRAFLRKFPELVRSFVGISYTGIDLRHTRAAMDGVDVRRELGVTPSAPLVVNASRVSFHKGQALLMQAAVRFLSDFPDAHLLIVGDGSSDDDRHDDACRDPEHYHPDDHADDLRRKPYTDPASGIQSGSGTARAGRTLPDRARKNAIGGGIRPGQDSSAASSSRGVNSPCRSSPKVDRQSSSWEESTMRPRRCQ